MRVEEQRGKMTPRRLRLYHSMYQLFSFTMLLALTTNNMGILWVAMEAATLRSEEHTSELQSLMRISYAVFCLKKKTRTISQQWCDIYHQASETKLFNISSIEPYPT